MSFSCFQGSIMVSTEMIEEVKKRLIKTYTPLAIYIFGSYVWGKPDEHSDLDLLVVIDKYNVDSYHTLVEGHKALADLPLAKDLLVFSKEEFDIYSKDSTRLCYQVKRKGKKIYATS